MGQSILESVNSDLTGYGPILERVTPERHEFMKNKIMDYLAIFKNKQHAQNNSNNPRFLNCPYTLPVLNYIQDPDGLFTDML